MKAAVLRGNNDIRIEQIARPAAGYGEVLVRVRAAGVCGSDVPRVLHGGAHSYPIVLGHEFAGDVVAVGEGVSKVSVGQRVAGAPLMPCMRCDDCARGNYSLCGHYSFIGSRRDGAFAEYIAVPETNAVPFDDGISYRQGALFEPSTVALHGLFMADYRGGEHVAVLGGGTIGQFAAQWARIYGARSVTVFDIDATRLALARRLGADAGILTSDPDFMKDALARTSGRGYGTVFETAGSPVTMRIAFALAAKKSSVCFIGTPHEPLTFEPALWEQMNRKEFLLTGSWMSYSAPFPGREWTLTADEFASGRLRYDDELVHAALPLEQAAEAFEWYKTPGLVSGRIIFEP
ncbi:MAG: galactitol-1-phosphate 5-dehydrogenase [Oscillospiraceae bacterium]|jgi:L-iditol 2-dehydrogenase|nr:galactitol-1-phosphate 5-dehydrogenase [Oscillospiraceae bacterium]